MSDLNDSPAPPQSNFKRTFVRAILIAIVCVLVLIGWCIYSGVAASLHAEHGLHAAILTCQVVTDYLNQSGGKWPRSWEELETTEDRKWGMWDWPKDRPSIEKYVAIDFTADPKQLASQTAEEFDAIKPIGPYYSYKHKWEFRSLLETLQQLKDK